MFKLKISLLLIFSPVFLFISQARAGLLGEYVASPSARVIDQRRTIGSGSRSDCDSNLPDNSVSLLVPEAGVVHRTSKDRPSLFLNSKIDSKVPFKFTLVNPEVAKPIVEKTMAISSPGIKEIKLPESTKLSQGKTYLWYVAIPCSNNPQEYQQVLRAGIEKVSLSTKVLNRLQLANTPAETASIYAANGIWYDALNSAISSQNNSNYLQQLLLSAGLPTNLDVARQ
jgi:hypothetical protein